THGEMLCPPVPSRVKKWNRLHRFRIDTRQIRTLFQVAVPTGEREIVKLRRTTVLLGDNMFDVERTAERRLWDVTILATMAGATPYPVRQPIHTTCCKVCRAFDCQ